MKVKWSELVGVMGFLMAMIALPIDFLAHQSTIGMWQWATLGLVELILLDNLVAGVEALLSPKSVTDDSGEDEQVPCSYLETLSPDELERVGYDFGVLAGKRPDIAHRVLIGFRNAGKEWGMNEPLGDILWRLFQQGKYSCPSESLKIPFKSLMDTPSGEVAHRGRFYKAQKYWAFSFPATIS